MGGLPWWDTVSGQPSVDFYRVYLGASRDLPDTVDVWQNATSP